MAATLQARGTASVPASGSSETAREAWDLVAALYREPGAPKVALCATGGAAQASAWLLATPGASSCVLDIQYPYHRGALVDYVRGDTDPEESFASMEMARRLARHARRRAFGIISNADSQDTAVASNILGVGYAGALATARERRGEDKFFIALLAADGHEVVHTVKFPKGQSTRPEQDELASLAVIRSIVNWTRGTVAEIGLDKNYVLEDSVRELAPRHASESVPGVLQTMFEDQQAGAVPASVWFWPLNEQGKQRAVDVQTALTEPSVRHLVISGSVQVVFELAVRNADKGDIDVKAVEERVRQFANPTSHSDGSWPVAVTQASIFVDKAMLFPASTFVVGYDTAVRLVDPKYYNNSHEQMCEALLTIVRQRCDFVVAGRVGADDTFLTLEDMRASIPTGFHSIFHGAQIVNRARTSKKRARGGHGADGHGTKQLFGEIPLCLDKATAKYMPYSAVAFPKIDNQTDTSVDTIWMVGFLDYERRRQKELALDELTHFRGLPGGHVPPSAAVHLRKAYSKDRAANREEDDTEKQKQNAPRLGARHRKAQKEPDRLKLSDEDAMKLRLLEERLSKKGPKRPWAIYTAENRRIRAALRDKNPGRSTTNVMRSRAFENMFELEREHMQAALCIQQRYRRYRMHLYWQEIVRKSRAVKVIQRYARGMLTRTLIRVWLLRKTWLVTVAQACVRGYISRRRTRERIAEMNAGVRKIQVIIRGYLGRLRADARRSELAASKIQRVWRGSVARVRCDRLWLDLQVTKIQQVVRGHLGRIEFARWQRAAHAGALVLQRVFRGLRGRWERNRLLWVRETERQRQFIQVLRAEDDFICDEITALETRMRDILQVDATLQHAEKQYEDMLHLVREKQFDYEAMQIERGRVDPLAMRQGWTEELDKYVAEHRLWLTNAKFQFLFVGATYYRQVLLDKADLESQLQRLQNRRERICSIRQTFVESLYQRESLARWEQRRRDRRRRIADQRRRWHVKWYTDDGKIDKKRRYGYPWDPSVFAGPERDTLCLGTVDLVPTAGTASSSLDRVIEQVALQNAQNEIVQHGALLAPLMDGMEAFSDKIERHFELERQFAEMMADDEED
ncbi:Abnormal spindle-like microcephaly-associated protein-like [Hondaea fermentalgiana]|uniref:Abnormal spindle-like microcephaly-associated protein-like n=1 Tax=Hondaea fermentalgiana TaxID=2315210 RepID=A0A2R5GZN0_9STRA|nr:Abnormal spindle-like microcephaly-associated protein-like [Hondaea fermentalgiana]|eukprot:GBG33504.1 Abnormal spindle-like microcephaly-associated protein-like [Hondaea fermentalgiana]